MVSADGIVKGEEHPPTASAVVYQTDRHTIGKKYDESKDKWVRIAKEKRGVDDASVIQSAIDATHNSGGGRTLIKAGEYICNRDIELKDGVYLSGEGVADLGLARSTVLKGYNISTALLKTTSKISTGIEDLAVWVSKDTSDPSADAIYVTLNDRSYIGRIAINSAPRDGLMVGSGSGVSLIEHIRLDNIGRHAVWLGYCSDSVVRFIDATAGDSGRGLMISGGGHLRIYSCNLYLCHDGITVDYATDVDLIGCRVNDNDDHGLWIGANARGIRVIGGSAYANGAYGYWIQSSAEDVTIISAKSYNNGSNGFYINNGNKINLIDCSAWDDQDTHTQYRGVHVAGGSNITIRDFKSLGGHIYNDVELTGGSNVKVLGGQFTTVRNDIGATIRDVIGYTTENSDTTSIVGDGSTTTFNIPHGLVSTPSYVDVNPKGGAPVPDSIDADDTNITLTFSTAPASGTYYYWWKAEV